MNYLMSLRFQQSLLAAASAPASGFGVGLFIMLLPAFNMRLPLAEIAYSTVIRPTIAPPLDAFERSNIGVMTIGGPTKDVRECR